MLMAWLRSRVVWGRVLAGLTAGMACLLLSCAGAEEPDPPSGPKLQPSAMDYLTETKTHLSKYQADIAAEAATGDAGTYYRTSYYLHGMAAAAEATGDTEVMDALVGYADQIINKATPLVRNGITYQQIGPWDVNGHPQLLQTFQIGGALARTAAIIALRPEFKARYSAQLDKIVAFVDQSVFKYWFDKTTGYYPDPSSSRLGGQIPWLSKDLGGWGSYPVWNDKCSHLGMMATWMYQATGDPLYLEYASRVAKGFRSHITVQNGCWIWDLGIVPISAGENQNGSPDTSHANREPMMVVSMYEAGIEFTLEDVQAIAATFTKLIWNRSDTDPMFANYITGGNQKYASADPWENGVVFSGWVMLGRHSTEAQRVLALSYQYIRTRHPLNNISLSTNANSYGLVEFSGTLARNVAH